MKTLLFILGTLPLLAQPAATTSDASSPVPSSEPVLTGWIDLGYRWDTGVAGSLDTYRSIINLGSGPKLLGTDFNLADPKHRWFDTISVRADTWGDEPSSSVHVAAKKSGVYDFNADYRDFAYFNFLPSYADPLLSQGVVLDEQSFDTRRKIAALSLDIRPGHWWTTYVGWDHDSGSGTGASVFVTDGNQYPVPNTLSDSTDLYRAGVRFEKPHFHVTLEEGGTVFKSDQSLFQNPGSTNYGNFSAPVFGQTLDLTSLLAAYGASGSSAYTKALLTASPASWIDIYGQFLFSQPDTHVNYQQTDAGSLFSQSQLLFYSSEQQLATTFAEQPHTTASLGAEIRPLKRVRIVESWMTDRLHDAGSAESTQDFLLASLLATALASNYSQESIDVFFDVSRKLVLRGGYRYVWGDASYVFLPPAGLASSAEEQLRRNVGVGSATYRPSQKISLTGEFEGASSSGVYFRTSLYNYQKVRAQVHYQLLQSLSVSADFTLLNNQNPLAGTPYDYSSHQESLSFYWAPRGSKIFDIQGSYSRSDLKSNISFLEPETLSPLVSAYRDNAHTGTALLDVAWPGHKRFAPKLAAGGSFFISSGSQPTSYYQPVAKLWVPLGKHVRWFSEWRYYGYGETFNLYEGFRTHLVTTGVRLTP
ncbi:MAG TPA: MtrB/PioB family outer membrane beta-barrel protein [Bryobacteraceae bacterium]|nr:MtrB/PioB family outer membrane beta-barrel protein [Bryobacteraceae bacterium]